VLDTAEPRHDASGVFLGHIGSVVDITDRKLEEERRNLLVGELNHRIRNNLALVQSLVVQTLKGSDEAEAAGATISARLRALADAHDTLTRGDWQRAALRQLVERAVAPFHGEGSPRFDLKGPDLAVSARTAVALSLSLHELATNAAKYGALSNATGRVAIAWSTAREGDRFILEWREHGGPAITPPERAGFGSRLIERSVRGELSATVETDYAPEGLTCTIRAPLSAIVPREP
jgi:two-component sensor histidine kinase